MANVNGGLKLQKTAGGIAHSEGTSLMSSGPPSGLFSVVVVVTRPDLAG